MRRPPGYTLVEILIVMFIISIVTSAALLSIGRNDNKRIENVAKELAQIMMLAEEQAMLQPMVLGLSLEQQQLQFTRLAAVSNDEKEAWLPLQDKLLDVHTIPSGIQVAVKPSETSDDAVSKKMPQIIISTNGEVTPFTIYVGKTGEKPRYAVIGKTDGSITTQALS